MEQYGGEAPPDIIARAAPRYTGCLFCWIIARSDLAAAMTTAVSDPVQPASERLSYARPVILEQQVHVLLRR